MAEQFYSEMAQNDIQKIFDKYEKFLTRQRIPAHELAGDKILTEVLRRSLRLFFSVDFMNKLLHSRMDLIEADNYK